MRYISTRGLAPPVSFLDALLNGMAPDGGLYVPETWPAGPTSDQGRFNIANQHYSFTAIHTLTGFAPEDLGWAQEEGATSVCNEAYLSPPSQMGDVWRAKWPQAVTPLRQIGPGSWLLELFHGPSLSFKDVAMQMIAPLYDLALRQRSARLSVVCATSGDTGGAAVEALKGRDRVDLFVLMPKARISEVQRRFMTTADADNIHAIEIDGDFDACQAIVKRLFADLDFAARAQLSGVNSINWARIVAQSVYFQIAAHTLGAHGPVSFVVPTGNFGDAYSGWVAKQLKAPIGRIALATNENDILSRALQTGRYERGMSKATLSPAMDIQVASNFERILFEALGRDSDAVRSLYGAFAQSGSFDIPDVALARLREDFVAQAVNDAQTEQQLREAWAYDQHALCPHTAVGLAATHGFDPPIEAPIVYLATAHPAKFPETIARVSGHEPALPAHCADLFARAENINALPDDAERVKAFIRERSRAWT